MGTTIWNSIIGLEVIPLAQEPAGPDLFSMLPLMLAIFFIFYLVIMRPQQRERAKHQTLLNNLKKNDRVVTVGGIYGVVTNVRRDNNEVVIKVDEGKLRVTLGSIARVIVDESESVSSTK